jgi:hypothetical protein
LKFASPLPARGAREPTVSAVDLKPSLPTMPKAANQR